MFKKCCWKSSCCTKLENFLIHYLISNSLCFYLLFAFSCRGPMLVSCREKGITIQKLLLYLKTQVLEIHSYKDKMFMQLFSMFPWCCPLLNREFFLRTTSPLIHGHACHFLSDWEWICLGCLEQLLILKNIRWEYGCWFASEKLSKQQNITITQGRWLVAFG